MLEGKMNWNLDDVLSVSEFDNFYKEIETDIGKFESFYGTLHPKMKEEDFKKFINFDESFKEKIARLESLPDLMEAADQKSETAKLLKNKAQDLYLKAEDATRKIGHWMIGKEVEGKKRLDDENAKRLFSAVPDLEYVLTHDRESEKYILNEAEERIVSKKDMTGVSVLVDMWDLIETEFEYDFKPKGAERSRKIKTQSELMSFVHSDKGEEREAAYSAMLEKQKENLDKLFMIYQARVKDWNNGVELRGYDSAISMRNHGNHVPDEAITTLLDVCSENKDIFQRYFKWKAKELGMEKLQRSDIYAPLGKEEENISFDKGVEMVLKTFKKFSPGFYEKAKKIIDENHIDSHPSEVKQGGGFCATISPNITPYVLLNHTGKLRDVSVLAHELGHGIHALYANKLPISSQHSKLPLAETASTFSEMIMFEKLFDEAENDKVRKSMLSDRMADAYGTIMRQSDFVRFELEAHEAIKKGVTAEEVSDIYSNILKEQFGDSVEIEPMFRYEWSYIPHFVHTPFYCYAYNFGELLSLSLFAEYKKQGENFIPKIEKILSQGSSKSPQEILNNVGVDMTSRDFWQGSFDVVRGWQKKLEEYK